MDDETALIPYGVNLPVEQDVMEGQVTISQETPHGRHKKLPPLEQAIETWLAEKRGKSKETYTAYKRIMTDFRAFLPEYASTHGLTTVPIFPNQDDPDSDEWDTLYNAVVAFLPLRKEEDGRFYLPDEKVNPVAVATSNQRAAALRSFYAFWTARRYYSHNPLALLKADKGKAEHAAYPIDSDTVKRGLRSINTHTLAGKRDKALLSILLQTARRVSEVRNLKWKDIHMQEGKMMLAFLAKGKEEIKDTLDAATQRVFDDYRTMLTDHFQRRGQTLTPEHPVFMGLGNRSHGKPLSIQFVSKICATHLGESRVHATRHTWAVRATEQGAGPNEIRKQLGHATLAHTIKYLEDKQAHVNKWADTLAKEFGIAEDE